MPRVTVVEKARKSPGKCSKCGDTIPIGGRYRHWSFRYGGKRIRCMKGGCTPVASDLTSNEQLSNLYAANETAETDLATWESDDVSDLESIRDQLAEAVGEVAEGFREKAQNIEDGFKHATSASEEMEEKASEADSYQSEIESVSFEAFEPVDASDQADEDNQREAWREEQREQLLEAISNCPL